MTEALLSTAPAAIPLTVNGHAFRMVPVRGGTFRMGTKEDDPDKYGDEDPDHDVRVPNFSLGQFPVTQALWRAVAEALPDDIDPAPSYFKGDGRPVECVSWEDVQIFLEKLNRLLPGWNFRLPTEAEWEYAARGGHTMREGSGNLTKYAGSDRLETVGWWDGNSHGETKPVGLKLPNALGLFDMSGNVWEWCADWYDSKFYEKCAKKGVAENPRNDEAGSDRVLRGGSWSSHSDYCRVALRYNYYPEIRLFNIGFRLAASPSSSVAGP